MKPDEFGDRKRKFLYREAMNQIPVMTKELNRRQMEINHLKKEIYHLVNAIKFGEGTLPEDLYIKYFEED